MERDSVVFRRAFCASLFCATAFITLPSIAHAQAANEAATDEAAGNEIVVTALKRETSLQDTPISISAIGGESLKTRGIKDVSDLASSVPSLTFVDSGPATRRVAIRGIQSAGEPTVGVYYDETPVTGSPGNAGDAGGSTPELRLFDVDRVEVLRGPQGTLYGSSSMGGTIRALFNKPSDRLEAAFDSTVATTRGGDPTMEAQAMVNVPIVSDKLAVRAVGYYSVVGGYIDNVSLGIDDINERKTWGGRLMLRANPTERLTLDLAAYISRAKTDSNAWMPAVGAYKTAAFSRQPVTDENELYSLTANWDLDAVVVTGLFSHARKRYTQAGDVSPYIRSLRTPARCASLSNRGAACDATQLASFYDFIDYQRTTVTYSPNDDMHATTAELRASSDGSSWFNWTIGGFYSERKADVERAQVVVDAASGRIIEPLQYATTRVIDDELKQLAGFGEISAELIDGLTLTAGARVFEYKKEVNSQTLISSYLVGAVAGAPSTVSTKESGTVLKFNASYDFTPDLMVYASASQGFRPGGVNSAIGLAPEFQRYGSDELWNYEIGTKANLFDRAVSLSLDVFQIDWTNIQVSGRTANGAFGFITNAGGARVRGVEAEVGIQPYHGLSLSFSGSYLDPVLTENQTNGSLVAAGLKGDRIPFISKVQLGGALDYIWSITDNFSGRIHIDGKHAGDSYSDFRPTGTYTRRIAPYELVNARIGIDEERDGWGLYLFVTNLLDDEAIVRASSSSTQLGVTSVNSAAPRTIGVNFTKRF